MVSVVDSVDNITGVGDKVARLYGLLGIHRVDQLIDYYPRKYEDYSVVSPIRQLRPGAVTIKASIGQTGGRYGRRGLHVTEAVATDATGSVRLVWFNQPYRIASFKSGAQYYISGNFELSHRQFAIMNPSTELVSEFPLNTARIVPVYRETKGLSSHQIRRSIKQLLPLIRDIPETLPAWLIEKHQLMSRAEAVEQMHFPSSSKQLEAAKRRLGFEEVLELSLAGLLNRYEIMSEFAPPVPFEEKIAKQFVSHLPFKLTDTQRKAVWRIYLDMQKEHPMNRLVEGDVGSGKTVVAAMAAVMVLTHGNQVAFMAPTEILARQHEQTLKALLTPLGLDATVGLLVGVMTVAKKKQVRSAITKGAIRLIVGTQALIQETVDMHRLELVVIDEQHRFGVEQRKKLIAKAGHMPHVLNLTATPIPRTLALTLYGELDISRLDHKPIGRGEVRTEICSPNSRTQLYRRIKVELGSGRQMFVVCPLISESSISDTISAEKMYEQLRTRDFKEYRIGLLHGKMKSEEKNTVMQAFVSHALDILVSTTVIEVGVDVPNASIMLIEGAERFGLAQIHQLRGRVGRGTHQAYCFLMTSDSNPPLSRLRVLERSNDGFRLAELDMRLRGPGAIYGTAQHGELDLRIAELSDVKLITQARHAAQEFIDRKENLPHYSHLQASVKHLRAVTNLN